MKKSGNPVFLSLAIPFYNEEDNALKCIKSHAAALSKAGIAFEIIAVDNASVDKTSEILDKLKSNRVKVVHVKKNVGYGNGILQGWRMASGNYVGFTCGDNEVAADSVVEIMKKMQREDLGLCKGKRVLRTYSAFRKIESIVYNSLFCRLLLGYKHGDINGYPKIMRRELFQGLAIESKGPMFDTEIMVKASEAGAKIGSVNIAYKKRAKGKSTVPFYIAIIFMGGLLKFAFWRFLRKFGYSNAGSS